MKKFAILLLILILVLCTYFGMFYKKVPFWLENKYKTEIENYINKNVSTTQNEIDRAFLSCEGLEQLKKHKEDKKALAIIKECKDKINYPEYEFYIGLIDITKKYTNIKEEDYATGESVNLAIFIYPYLMDNKVNLSELEKLSKEQTSQLSELEQYYLKQ